MDAQPIPTVGYLPPPDMIEALGAMAAGTPGRTPEEREHYARIGAAAFREGMRQAEADALAHANDPEPEPKPGSTRIGTIRTIVREAPPA